MIKNFSPNMLKTYKLCPKKFYFRYEKNISMPVNDDIFEFGKNIHALASYYLRGENIDNMEVALTEQENRVWQYLKRIKYFSYEVINTEYSLSVRIGNYFFGGRLDALVKKDGHYYILDYKTGSAPKNAKYDFQTMIYLLAVKVFFNTNNVTFIYIDLKNKDEVQISLTATLEDEYKKELLTLADNINSGEEEKENTKKSNCNCEYNLICY